MIETQKIYELEGRIILLNSDINIKDNELAETKKKLKEAKDDLAELRYQLRRTVSSER